jgi:micrococcal nuclease
VELENVSNEPVSLDGWQVVSVRAFQIHRGIGGMLMPGERKAFPYTGRGNMWNNRERDDGALYDPTGKLISYWSDTE